MHLATNSHLFASVDKNAKVNTVHNPIAEQIKTAPMIGKNVDQIYAIMNVNSCYVKAVNLDNVGTKNQDHAN